MHGGCPHSSACEQWLLLPGFDFSMDTHKYTVCLSLNSGSRGETQPWEPCCPVGLGRVLVDRVFCARCRGEAVRGGGGALRHVVLVWQWRGVGAALPWGGRACSCRGSLSTAWAVHRVCSAVVAVCVCARRGVYACVSVCVCVSASPFHNGSVII